MALSSVVVIGGGLAGCECALLLARHGIRVTLFEMKPVGFSPAHTTEDLAELVCSNSFRSTDPDTAVGILKQELRTLGSVCMQVAEVTQIPAGKALAVDRELFSRVMTQKVLESPNITLVRKEIQHLDLTANDDLMQADAVVVAAGPLASNSLVTSLQNLTGEGHLYFFDAIAPVIDAATVNTEIAFWGGRYRPDEVDYLNCPMTEEEYMFFYQALLDAEKVMPHSFEKEIHFEGCMPIEALAARGEKTLVFGPLKPVGFTDPRTGKRPFALLQLRAENNNKTMLNLVGCQTKLTFSEQQRVFRLIPGLENVQFVRYGSMHRNTFVNAPQVLNSQGALLASPRVFLAGQITGVEGYVESIASGLWTGHQVAAIHENRDLPQPPPETAIGGLILHTQTPVYNYQPSNVQFGLMPTLDVRAKKADRKKMYSQRAMDSFAAWLQSSGLLG